MRMIFALAGFVLAALAPAGAQEWPSQKPIRILVGFGAGGGTDIVTRIVAQPLGELLGQTIVVENKAGAGSTLASNEVAKAPKDGYTAVMLSAGHTVSAAMFKSLPYDSVKDFAPVALVGDSCLVIVARKDLPANDIKGLVALAKKDPGKLNFASVGVGSTQHFSGELLNQLTGIQVQHVPYRGTPAVVTALRSGEADYAVELAQTVAGQIEAGEMKLLAVGSPQRWPTLPNAPTVAEQGVKEYAVVSWYGLAYPAGTPAAIVNKTNAAMKEVLARPAIQEQLAKVGVIAHYTTPAEFGAHLDKEVATWKSVREKANIAQN
ncbi:MAG: tripartite tricarboxylate transporter substrate binding protein [Pseudolabrys sp.]|nr:tripartite tricarboxylate transporter substrate binding protein [Pseudolabrys sp.]MBV9953762.1 tripartite tricarboxylate transporter substrate binding protein [Pseudolabrys sp.]